MSIHRVAGCGVPLLLFVLSVFSIGCTGGLGDDGQCKVEYSRGSGLPTGDYSVQRSPRPVVNPIPPTGPPDDPKVMELGRKVVLDEPHGPGFEPAVRARLQETRFLE